MRSLCDAVPDQTFSLAAQGKGLAGQRHIGRAGFTARADRELRGHVYSVCRTDQAQLGDALPRKGDPKAE